MPCARSTRREDLLGDLSRLLQCRSHAFKPAGYSDGCSLQQISFEQQQQHVALGSGRESLKNDTGHVESLCWWLFRLYEKNCISCVDHKTIAGFISTGCWNGCGFTEKFSLLPSNSITLYINARSSDSTYPQSTLWIKWCRLQIRRSQCLFLYKRPASMRKESRGEKTVIACAEIQPACSKQNHTEKNREKTASLKTTARKIFAACLIASVFNRSLSAREPV